MTSIQDLFITRQRILKPITSKHGQALVEAILHEGVEVLKKLYAQVLVCIRAVDVFTDSVASMVPHPLCVILDPNPIPESGQDTKRHLELIT